MEILVTFSRDRSAAALHSCFISLLSLNLMREPVDLKKVRARLYRFFFLMMYNKRRGMKWKNIFITLRLLFYF